MSLPSDNPLLHARELRFAHGTTAALRGVSLDVGEGESVAITGPGGAGKSTLLHCVAGLLRPDAGEIWVNGVPLHTLNEQRRARLRHRSFGIVWQFDRGHRLNQLLPELTIGENIALPLYFAGVGRDEAGERASRWLRRVELEGHADLRPHELTDGELRRAAIARALAVERPVLLVDEPVEGLDTDAAAQVLRMLCAAARSHGMTLLLATRDVRLGGYADRAIALVDGRIAHDSLAIAP